jgi:hypothetical protein
VKRNDLEINSRAVAYSEDAIRQKDVLTRNIDIIPKPVKPDFLLQKIRSELDRV